MIKVAAYCRVSTAQDDQINSFESQQQYFRDYIRHHPDWELSEIYADEGITGTSTKKRTQFNQMMLDARDRKFQIIITKEVSRFSRNILDTITYTRQLKALGIGVQFMLDGINTMNPDAELYLSIMASLAQEESRKTSSRVVWGQTRQMEKGVVFGRSLLGYDVKDGTLTVNPEGAELVRLIFRKYGLEQMGTSEIARFLTREGYHTYSGNTDWSAGTVLKILKNEKYVGDLIQKKTYTPDYLTHEKRRNTGQVPLIRIKNHHEPIISRETWDLVQMRLRKSNKHMQAAAGHSTRYAFSGKIRCGQCGSVFTARYKYLKDGTKIRRWSCAAAAKQGKAACDVGKLLREEDTMLMMNTALQYLQINKKATIGHILDGILAAGQGSADSSEQLCKELNRIEKKKEAMLDSFFSGDISRAEMLSMKQRYDDQLKYLHEKFEFSSWDMEPRKNEIENLLISILNGEIQSDVFYKNILHSITVYKDRHMEMKLKNLPHVFRFIG